MDATTFSVGIYTAITEDLAKNAFAIRNSTINLPVLDLFSRQDIFGFEAHFDIHQVYPQLQRVILEKAGHYPWLEQEETYTYLQAFLKG